MNKFFSLKGRATLKEYEYTIFLSFVFFYLSFVTSFIFFYEIIGNKLFYTEQIGQYFILTVFISAIIFIMVFISVSVRRLHDIGMSGWWIIICFIPYSIVWKKYTDEGQNGPNKYGPDPREEKKQKTVKNNNVFFTFKGRLRRKDYIIFTIVNIILYFLLVSLIIFLINKDYFINQKFFSYFPLISVAYFPGYLLLSQSIIIRRQKDMGIENDYTEWFFYLFFPTFGLIIIFVIIYNIVLSFVKGQKGPNKFGPDPREKIKY